jgi:hypothetical protein
MPNRNKSHKAKDDKQIKADDNSVSQHISNAVLAAECSSHNQLSQIKSYSTASDNIKRKADKIISTLNGLDVTSAKNVLRIVSNYIYGVSEKKLSALVLN